MSCLLSDQLSARVIGMPRFDDHTHHRLRLLNILKTVILFHSAYVVARIFLSFVWHIITAHTLVAPKTLLVSYFTLAYLRFFRNENDWTA
jgi:hypothetical protein